MERRLGPRTTTDNLSLETTRDGKGTYELDFGRVLERDLVLARKVAELLLGDVDARLGDVVDLALLEEVVEVVDCVVESRRLDLSLSSPVTSLGTGILGDEGHAHCRQGG